MMESYNRKPLAPLFFIIFLIITLYLITNVLLAVVYSTFQNIQKKKFRALYLHRRYSMHIQILECCKLLLYTLLDYCLRLVHSLYFSFRNAIRHAFHVLAVRGSNHRVCIYLFVVALCSCFCDVHYVYPCRLVLFNICHVLTRFYHCPATLK